MNVEQSHQEIDQITNNFVHILWLHQMENKFCSEPRQQLKWQNLIVPTLKQTFFHFVGNRRKSNVFQEAHLHKNERH